MEGDKNFELRLVESLGRDESPTPDSQKCSKCKKTLSLSEFHKSTHNMRCGRQSKCKKCKNAENTAWRKANPDKLATAKRRHYDKHREKILAQQREARQELENADPAQAKLMRRKRHMAHRYGLTVQQFERLLEEFGGKCGICRRTAQRLVVDHDHETGAVRGILCVKCNVSLGSFGDSIRGLKRAITYLQEAKKHGDRREDDCSCNRGGSVERHRQRTLGFTLADWTEAGC